MKALKMKISNVPIVAVTGGKGGTGKTTVSVNLALGLVAHGLKVLLVDADVDGPCCATLLGKKLEVGEEVSTFLPVIDETKCVGCRSCVEACHEHALVGLQIEIPRLFEELCSGCKACQIVCKHGAIADGRKEIGFIYTEDFGDLKLIVGELKPSEPRSPIMARATVQKALNELQGGGWDVVIIDTSPGVHNTVAQALWVADLALAVTEPTPLGAHDLNFILDLASKLELPAEIVINKSNIPGGLKDDFFNIAKERKIAIAAEIPLDNELLRSYVSGEPLLKKPVNSPAARALSSLVHNILNKFEGAGKYGQR